MKKKRLIALILITILVQGTTVFGANTVYDFKDAHTGTEYGYLGNHWATRQIDIFCHRVGIDGYPDGTFRPNKTIAAAELITLILKASNNSQNLVGADWAEKIMNRAYELGICTEEDIPYSEAKKTISREKMAYVLVNSAEKILKEDTVNIKMVDTAVIPDLNSASISYQDEILTAYSMGLLAGTGSGYNPKSGTTRAEACTILNRLFLFSNRVFPNYEKIAEMEPGKYIPLKDGSNVGKKGEVYPVEGQLAPNGMVITRDPETGVLGYGNGQVGHLYDTVGVPHSVTGEMIYFKNGSQASSSYWSPDMSGGYEKRGRYMYFSKDWSKISMVVIPKLNKNHLDMPVGSVADAYGNLIPGNDRNSIDAIFVLGESTNGKNWMLSQTDTWLEAYDDVELRGL